MSDLIRQYMGLRRGPVGLGNNPSPFPIQMPDIPEPAMPDQRYMTDMDMPPALRPGEQYIPGPAAQGAGTDDLMRYYQQIMEKENQKNTPGMRYEGNMHR